MEYPSIENQGSDFSLRHVNLKSYLRTHQREIERALDRHLPKANSKPATLHQAMRYAVLDGGKRVRALLAYAAGEVSGDSGIDSMARPLP